MKLARTPFIVRPPFLGEMSAPPPTLFSPRKYLMGNAPSLWSERQWSYKKTLADACRGRGASLADDGAGSHSAAAKPLHWMNLAVNNPALRDSSAYSSRDDARLYRTEVDLDLVALITLLTMISASPNCRPLLKASIAACHSAAAWICQESDDVVAGVQEGGQAPSGGRLGFSRPSPIAVGASLPVEVGNEASRHCGGLSSSGLLHRGQGAPAPSQLQACGPLPGVPRMVFADPAAIPQSVISSRVASRQAVLMLWVAVESGIAIAVCSWAVPIIKS
jgi:hypothetical protein